MSTTDENDEKGPIELSEDFVVTYNCHYDEYRINGKITKGWDSLANHTGKLKRVKDEINNKVKWRIVKTEKKLHKISWTFRLKDLKGSKERSKNIFVLITASTKGTLWTLTHESFSTILGSRAINEVHLPTNSNGDDQD